jgi:hypothetical protein
MNTLTLKVPETGTSFWLEVSDVGPNGLSNMPFRGTHYYPAEQCQIEVGSVFIKAQSTPDDKLLNYNLEILQQDGSWYAVLCQPSKNGWQHLRELTRKWLAMSPVTRMMQACADSNEMLIEETRTHLHVEPPTDEDRAIVADNLFQLTQAFDRLFSAIDDEGLSENELIKEFQRVMGWEHW